MRLCAAKLTASLLIGACSLITLSGLGVAPARRTRSIFRVGAPLSALITVAHAGQAPTILAADERVGHVFVLNSSFAPTISRRAASSSVSMLDARTGHVLNTVSVAPNLQSVVVDEQTKRVFVASEGPLAANGGPIGRGNVNLMCNSLRAQVASKPSRSSGARPN